MRSWKGLGTADIIREKSCYGQRNGQDDPPMSYRHLPGTDVKTHGALGVLRLLA